MKFRYHFSDEFKAGVNVLYSGSNRSTWFLWANDTTGLYKPFAGSISIGNLTNLLVDPYLKFYDKKNNYHKILGRYAYINNAQDNIDPIKPSRTPSIINGALTKNLVAPIN